MFGDVCGGLGFNVFFKGSLFCKEQPFLGKRLLEAGALCDLCEI